MSLDGFFFVKADASGPECEQGFQVLVLEEKQLAVFQIPRHHPEEVEHQVWELLVVLQILQERARLVCYHLNTLSQNVCVLTLVAIVFDANFHSVNEAGLRVFLKV